MSHDVFISYAHLDNVPYRGDKDNGWIKRLKTAISDDLSTRLGRKANVFYDKKNIQDGDKFKEEIKQALKESTTMLVVLSPTWANSEPCKSEYRFYQDENQFADSNTLIIERLSIDDNVWNDLKKLFRKLDQIHRRKFYKEEEGRAPKTYGVNEDEAIFYDEACELAYIIKNKLAETEDATNADEQRVFIYCATDNLSDTSTEHLLQLRRELRDYLEDKLSVGMIQRNWLTNDTAYEDAEALELALTEEIRKCDHFVQLVTKNTSGQVVAATQALGIAKALGKPVSVWSAAIASNEEITFSGSFEEFKQEVFTTI